MKPYELSKIKLSSVYGITVQPSDDFKQEALNDINKLCDKWKRIQNDYKLTDEEMEIAQFIIGKTQNMEFAIQMSMIEDFD